MNMVLMTPEYNSEVDDTFLQDVMEGLRKHKKTLPCKYLYDKKGSQIFEKICELDDYYITRTEEHIISSNLAEIAEFIGPDAVIMEPGAGNCTKAMCILTALQTPISYIPIDISSEILMSAKNTITAQLPKLNIQPIVGDFTQSECWPLLMQNMVNMRGEGQRRVVFFPGSTIGNFSPEEAVALLKKFNQQMSINDGLLISTDLVKDSVILHRAYHDSEHVTEEFNKNLLLRINNTLSGNFDLKNFSHQAFYHEKKQRVEMHLVSLVEQQVCIAGEFFNFFDRETIHTESSYKYTKRGFYRLLEQAGFDPCCTWIDENDYFAVHYAKVL
ncbi:MAG: L-histidine N(alpha)-methyltransferase [Gammaproteobacteria bacterium]|nr:L-histidine N(alpha)-methyltransferase [Gammaproteobacteria bacterium]